MKNNKSNNNNLKKAFYSTQDLSQKTLKVESSTNLASLKGKNLQKESYLNLITKVVDYFELKDSNSQKIEITFSHDELMSIESANSIPLNIKKFCTTVKITKNSSFGKSFLEIILFPISRNVVVDEKAIYLEQSNNVNHSLYLDLVLNENVREAFLHYVDQIPELKKGVITTGTTLKSFREGPVIKNFIEKTKEGSLSQEDRYAFVGLFLEAVLFEVIDNSKGKHSKSRIINSMIDLLSKART